MNQPIVFFAPEAIAGQVGVQVVDDETHEVTGVFLADGSEAPQPCSYGPADV
jgi:hypothetical protein